MNVFLAIFPSILATVLLIIKVSPPLAAFFSLISGLILLYFFPTTWPHFFQSQISAAYTGLDVIFIIFGGILLYQLMNISRAQDPLGDWITQLTGDPSRRILLMVLGITPFAESVTGFGVGVIIALPLLKKMGFSPQRSAVLSLLGLVAVPWGALAPGTLVAATLAHVSFQSLGVTTAYLSLPVFFIVGFSALVVGVSWRGALAKIIELFLVSCGLWVGILFVNQWIGTPLAGVLGSLAGISVLLLIVFIKEGKIYRGNYALARSLSPYMLLVFLLLVSKFFTLNNSQVESWKTFVLGPATWLMMTCLFTPKLLGQPTHILSTAIRISFFRWHPVAITTMLFMSLGAVMSVSGMVSTISVAASALGRGYALVCPWIGGLGGFLTGSNTGSNAIFAATQAQTAENLRYPILLFVAAQNVSAALLTMLSASRISLVTSLLNDDSITTSYLFRKIMLIDVIVLIYLGCILFYLA